VIRAFELALKDLGDPALRGIVLQSLGLALVAQITIAVLAWWGLQSFANFQWQWLNDAIRWLGGAGVSVLALMLFPACFGIVISVFLERIADIVESKHYPALGKAPGIPMAVGIRSGLGFFATLILLNLAMLPFYLLALFVAGLGALLFYGVNGFLAGREYYEQVALRRRPPADVKTWRSANTGTLWLTGAAIVFLGTIPILNLFAPVLGCAAMVHVAQKLRPPQPFPPTGARQ